jgi:hypothetical protein
MTTTFNAPPAPLYTPRPVATGFQTPERQAVEDALRTATITQPMTAEQASKLSGVSISITRGAINTIQQRGQCHNVNLGCVPARYAWGPAPIITREPVERHVAEGTYDGADLARPPTRTEGLRAFELPSRENGESVPRVRPVSLGSADAR